MILLDWHLPPSFTPVDLTVSLRSLTWTNRDIAWRSCFSCNLDPTMLICCPWASKSSKHLPKRLEDVSSYEWLTVTRLQCLLSDTQPPPWSAAYCPLPALRHQLPSALFRRPALLHLSNRKYAIKWGCCKLLSILKNSNCQSQCQAASLSLDCLLTRYRGWRSLHKSQSLPQIIVMRSALQALSCLWCESSGQWKHSSKF